MRFHNTCRSFPVAVNFHHFILLQCCNSIPQPQPSDSTNCLIFEASYLPSPCRFTRGPRLPWKMLSPGGLQNFATQSVYRTLTCFHGKFHETIMVRLFTRVLYCLSSSFLCFCAYSLYLSASTLQNYDDGTSRNSIDEAAAVQRQSERRSLKELEEHHRQIAYGRPRYIGLLTVLILWGLPSMFTTRTAYAAGDLGRSTDRSNCNIDLEYFWEY